MNNGQNGCQTHFFLCYSDDNKKNTFNDDQWRFYIVKFWIHAPGPIFFIFMQFLGNVGVIIGSRNPFGFSTLWEILDQPMTMVKRSRAKKILRVNRPSK